MVILSCNDIHKSFGDNTILQGISFSIESKDKLGVIGVNGAGKSTLFNILCGKLTPDTGNFFISKSSKIGYLNQSFDLNQDNTIWDEVLTCFSDLIELEGNIKQLEMEISVEENPSILESLMSKYSDLSEKFSILGGFEYNSRSRGILKGLNFSEEQFSLKIQQLSGGQKTRLSMAKLLLKEPDILLLDEPTNHLDLNSIEWLENFLKNYPKCVIVISHDRYFLDSVCTKTLELENTHGNIYSGNYSKYIKFKEDNRKIQQKHYELQQKEISRMEAFIEQQKKWNREKNIIAAESRQKAIKRMVKIDKPENSPDKIKFNLSSSTKSGNDVVFVENLAKSYPEKNLFSDISFEVKKSDRLFILGPNGCGKSTLLKILNETITPSSGSFKYGHNVKIALYDQELEGLNLQNTILDEIIAENHTLSQTQVRNVLASFLFKDDDVLKFIHQLSGGEKSRIALIKVLLSDANLLLLDEPTNHLDISSKEALESALSEFNGTIISVSHDRYFVNKLATRILELNGDNYIDYKDNYSAFLEYKSRLDISEQGKSTKSVQSESKRLHINKKEEKATIRKLKNQLKKIEDEISNTENSIEQVLSKMSLPDVASDHVKLAEFHTQHSSLNTKLYELYKKWDALTDEYSDLNPPN